MSAAGPAEVISADAVGLDAVRVGRRRATVDNESDGLRADEEAVLVKVDVSLIAVEVKAKLLGEAFSSKILKINVRYVDLPAALVERI